MDLLLSAQPNHTSTSLVCGSQSEKVMLLATYVQQLLDGTEGTPSETQFLVRGEDNVS
jgi:hypothetical protein